MKHLLSALALAFLLSAAPASAQTFTDLEEGWARQAAISAAEKGIMKGYADGTFRGNDTVSRYELATIAERLLSADEQAHGALAPKSDLDALRAILQGMTSESHELKAGIERLEDGVERLDNRLKR